MAEGFAHSMNEGDLEIESAGMVAAGLIPETVAAMEEIGISLEGQHSKRLSGVDLTRFELIVTLSDQAYGHLKRGHEGLPLLHRPVLDPVGIPGIPTEIARMFALTRDDVREVVAEALEVLRTKS